MKQKIRWFIPVLLVTLALVMASCAPAAKPTATPGAKADKPAYGGIINEHVTGSFTDAWDPFGPLSDPSTAVYESLLYGNYYLSEKENSNISVSFNEKTVAGWLAEKWEMPDPQTFVFHLRKGVRFQNKPPVNGRELTADDVKWSVERTLASPLSGKGLLPSIDKITVRDKYTIVFHAKEARNTDFMVDAFLGSIASGGLVAPREVVDTYGEKGFSDWKNAVGTGPWIAQEYVRGSYILFKKNPDYWEFDKNYSQNKLPYADGMRVIIMPDAATSLAALRTGQVDRYREAKWDATDSLLKTNPQLKYRSFPAQGASPVAMNFKNKPFTDKRVRQALVMAIDHQAIVRDIYKGNARTALEGGAPYFLASFPDYQVQVNEFPQIVRDMYSHNVAKAKQLLAEAGYPDGFSTEILITQRDTDMSSLIKGYLADVGVKAELKVTDTSAQKNAVNRRSYPGMASNNFTGNSAGGSPAQVLAQYYHPDNPNDYSGYDDPAFMKTFEQAQQTKDYKTRVKLYKDIAIKVMEDAPMILMPSPDKYIWWQPWVKGYWGQFGMTWRDLNMQKHWWLDLDLKKSITGGN
ncbi:MAG: ABC transporter substrate-binding protein [Chloroflexi bacterium]|nr:ABC transporter substrate-binding protein [Chloroflexota bacterium]